MTNLRRADPSPTSREYLSPAESVQPPKDNSTLVSWKDVTLSYRSRRAELEGLEVKGGSITVVQVGPRVELLQEELVGIQTGEGVDHVGAEPLVDVLRHEFSFAFAVEGPVGHVADHLEEDELERSVSVLGGQTLGLSSFGASALRRWSKSLRELGTCMICPGLHFSPKLNSHLPLAGSNIMLSAHERW
jgi:hypothetical protein